MLIVSVELSYGQSIIQSTCINDTTILNPDVVDFSYEIALFEMRDKNHYYHDSIIVPQQFIDSINNYISVYHNAIGLNDSIIDYRTFDSYNLEFGEIFLTFDAASNCFYKEDNKLIITNDTLAHYIDSLSLYAQSWSDNEISLSDTNSMINIYGDFNLFYNISSVTNIDLRIIVVDNMPCYKSRSGDFNDNGLKIILSDVNYCDSNAYSYNWIYSVNSNCQIEVVSIPTSVLEKLNDLDICIYPNPCDNILHFEPNGQFERIKLIGLDGKTYLQSDILNDKSINLSGVRSGLYLIELKYVNGNVAYSKLIKK